jgi:hypothetical protein
MRTGRLMMAIFDADPLSGWARRRASALKEHRITQRISGG